MPPVQELLPKSLLFWFLLLAALSDVREQRIPNRLVVSGILVAVAIQMAVHGVLGALDAAGGAIVGLVAFLPFYLLKGMGAGDVKLMATASAFLDPDSAAMAAALSLIAGLLLALGLLGVQRVRPAVRLAVQQGSVGPSIRPAAMRFPYAPAIAVGTLAAQWL